jgi:ATP synthase protein I
VVILDESDNTKRSSANTPRAETGKLAKKIQSAKKDRLGKAAAVAMRQREMTGSGKAFRMVSEFVSAVIVATALGFAIDAIFGTRPIFMIVFLLMGFAAGMLNIVRAAKEMNANAPKPDPDKLVPIDDDDD